MKVLIGNDIRVKVQLSFNGVPANILSAKAMFVNKTMKDKLVKEYQKKNRFIGRFPIEPFVNEFEPNEYNINSCGMYPKYKAYVVNRYNGFGVRPNWKNCVPIKEVEVVEYPAKVSRDSHISVTATFPGRIQRYAGEYDLVIIAKIYDADFEGNERRITVIKSSVFELVSNPDEAVDNPVEIEIIDQDAPAEPTEDIYVVNGAYADDNIRLTRSDDQYVDVDVTPITGWHEELEEEFQEEEEND